MKYVQDSQLTDTLERQLIDVELAGKYDQPRPFSALRNGVVKTLDFIASLKATARRYNVQYVNG